MKRKSKLFFLASIIIILLILSACQSQYFDANNSISNNKEEPEKNEGEAITEIPNVIEKPNFMITPYMEEKAEISMEPVIPGSQYILAAIKVKPLALKEINKTL